MPVSRASLGMVEVIWRRILSLFGHPYKWYELGSHLTVAALSRIR